MKRYVFIDGGMLYRKLQREYRKEMKVFDYFIRYLASGINGKKRPYWYKLMPRPEHTTIIDGREIRGRQDILAEGKYDAKHKNANFYDKYLGTEKPHDADEFQLDIWIYEEKVELVGLTLKEGEKSKERDLIINEEIYASFLKEYPEFLTLRHYVLQEKAI